MKSKIVSTRMEPQDSKLLDELATAEGLDRGVMMRHILHLGLDAYRQSAALQAYSKGKLTLGRAAELAGLSQWDMLGVLEAHRTELTYDRREFERDVKTIDDLSA